MPQIYKFSPDFYHVTLSKTLTSVSPISAIHIAKIHPTRWQPKPTKTVSMNLRNLHQPSQSWPACTISTWEERIIMQSTVRPPRRYRKRFQILDHWSSRTGLSSEGPCDGLLKTESLNSLILAPAFLPRGIRTRQC